MTVYIDDAYLPYGRMKMCHMIADTEEELHQTALRIGMKRSWFQCPRNLFRIMMFVFLEEN